MNNLVKEYTEKAGDHVVLIKLIRETCKNNEKELAEYIISNSKEINEKVKYHALSACFDTKEGRDVILSAGCALPRPIYEMIVCEKIKKIDKTELLEIIGKLKKRDEFKMKILKKLYKRTDATELADEFITKQVDTLESSELAEALKYASIPLFIEKISCCKDRVSWSELAFQCTSKLLAYYESEFKKSMWHEYSSKWNSICSKHKYKPLRDKPEFLLGLLELYEKFPPFICDYSKVFSKNTPDYTEKLEIDVLNGLTFKQRPKGDVSLILDHFKSPEKWLKKPFQEYFIQNYLNLLNNWNLTDIEMDELLIQVLSEVSDLNPNVIDFSNVPSEKFQSECWNEIFKRLLSAPFSLNLKQFSIVLEKIETLMNLSLEKLKILKDIGCGIDLNLDSSIEISYLRTVMDKKFSLYTNFIRSFLKFSTKKFKESIEYSPKNVEKILKLLEVIEKAKNVLTSYYDKLCKYQAETSTTTTEVIRQSSLIPTVRDISPLRNFVFNEMIDKFQLPIITFSRQNLPEYHFKDQIIKDCAVRINKELIEKDIFGDWVDAWFKTFLSHIENSLSLSSVPSHQETETFGSFKSLIAELHFILPFEKFKQLIFKPSIELLDRLDAYEYAPSILKRYCYLAIKNIDFINTILSNAATTFIFHNEKLDEIFKGNLIVSEIRANGILGTGKTLTKARTITILDSLTAIFSNLKSSGKKPDYLNLFSSDLMKKLAERFKNLLFIKNFNMDSDYKQFLKASGKMKGFSSVLCRKIIAELTKDELDDLIDKSAKEFDSVFENLFVTKLPLNSSIVKTFINKKLDTMETLEEKLALYRKFYTAAVEQNSYELSDFDSLLAISSFIQPKIARVDWKAKKVSHPMDAQLIIKAYLSNDAPRVFSTPENLQKVLDHLKAIWKNIFAIDPRSYADFVSGFCYNLLRSVDATRVEKSIKLKIFSESIHELVINEEFDWKLFEILENFTNELQYDALIHSEGLETAQTKHFSHSFYSCDWLLNDSGAITITNKALERKFNKKIVEWSEESMLKFIKKYYPTMKLSTTNDGKSLYSVSIASYIVKTAVHYRSFSPLCSGTIDVIADYCRSNQNNTLELQSYDSVLYRSLEALSYPQIPGISVNNKCWLNSDFPNKKDRPDLFVNHGNMFDYCKKFYSFLEEFGHLFVAKIFPIEAYYLAKYIVSEAKQVFSSEKAFKVAFYKSAIAICPSFLRINEGESVCQLLMEVDPMYLLDIFESCPSRLLSNGVFVKDKIKNFAIPFRNGKLPNNLSESDLLRLKDYFMKNLLNTELAFADRLSSVYWLTKSSCSLLELDEIFPELYAKLSPDSKELKLPLLRKLYESPNVQKALKICFSEIILNDADAMVHVFTGLTAKNSSDDFVDVIYPYIDPSNPNNEDIFTKKMNFLSQNAFLRLISTLNDGKVLFEFWERRQNYKEHFKTTLLKNVLKLLCDKKNDNADAAPLLNLVKEAILDGDDEYIKEILSIKPSSTILLDQNLGDYDGIKNKAIAEKYSEMIHKHALEKISSKVLLEQVVSYCKSWHGFEGFISEHHMSLIVKLIENILIENDDDENIVKSFYDLFPLYAKFLAKNLKNAPVQPYTHLHPHFQRILSDFESSTSATLATETISNLKKLNLIAEMKSSKDDIYHLRELSGKNVKEMAEIYKLASKLYEKMK